eukprot:3707025-Amphidinium_carterae.1
MAQTPNQTPIDIVSVPSSTVGPNTQETLPYQQQIENYSGPPIIHGSPRSVHEVMSPKPGDVIGQTAGYTAQSQAAPSSIPAVDLASIPAGIVSRGRTAVSNVGASVFHQLFSQNTPSPTNAGTLQRYTEGY